MSDYNGTSLDSTSAKYTKGSYGSQLWNNLARAIFPDTISETIAISAHLYERHGIYSQGLMAAVSYFITELEVHGKDLDAPDRYEITRFLNNDAKIMEDASRIGAELMAYGTIFLTVHVPFYRNLRCPYCGGIWDLKSRFPGHGIEFRLNGGKDSNPGFFGNCLNKSCTSKGEIQYEISDTPIQPSSSNPIKPLLMPPQIMRIIESPMTGKRTPLMEPYRYQELMGALQKGIPEVLYDTRWEYIQAAAKQQPIVMNEDSMLCLALEPSAPEKPKYKGWGKPSHMAAFPYAAQLVLLEAYNEVITAEFSIPRRVISPPSTGASLRNTNQNAGSMGLDHRNLMEPSDFLQKVGGMMRRMRSHPEEIGVSPFPLQYQLLGAEAGTLVTNEQLEYYEDRLLRAMGIPPELYKGGINAKVASPSMYGFRLFERKWKTILNKVNIAMDWLSDRYADKLQWPNFMARLASSAMLSDPQLLQYVQTGTQMGDISKHTFNRMIGIDGDYERDMVEYEQQLARKNMEEYNTSETKDKMNQLLMEEMPQQAEQQELTQEVQTELAGAGAVGTPPPVPPGSPTGGGNIPPQGVGAPVPGNDLGKKLGIQALEGIVLPMNLESVDQMRSIAKAVANQIVSIPIPQRGTITENIKDQYPNLHQFVMAELDNLENQAANQGVQALRQGAM